MGRIRNTVLSRPLLLPARAEIEAFEQATPGTDYNISMLSIADSH